MAVSVDRHGVTRGDDLGCERRMRTDLLADEEERRVRAGAGEDLEYRGRALRMRAVVERQRDTRRVRAAQRHAQDAGHRRHDRRERRQRPCGAHGEAGAERGARAHAAVPFSARTSAAADGRCA